MGFNILLFSCKDELDISQSVEEEYSTVGPLKAIVTFENTFTSEVPGTRFPVNPTDGWTMGDKKGVYTFTKGDTIGVFTRQGNLNIEGGGPLINIPMHIETQEYNIDGKVATTLVNDTVTINTAGMRTNEAFMYFPYSSALGSLANYNTVNGYMEPKEGHPMPGIPLRVKDPEDGILKSHDIAILHTLSSDYLKRGILTGAFYHAFSRLIIMRGEGFDNPVRYDSISQELVPDSSINVIMNNPATHFRIVSYPYQINNVQEKIRWHDQFVYDPQFLVDGAPLDSLQARTWQAWKGEPFEINNVSDTIVKDAYYVVIPASYLALNTPSYYGTQNAPTMSVSYIELYDNNGTLQKVSSIALKNTNTSAETKTPEYRYQYPLVIETNELGVTANPVIITPWQNNRPGSDITEERGAGISTVEEFQSWATIYRSYTNPSTSSDQKDQDFQELQNYGDFENGIFHFYINNDIDFSGQTWYYIPTLNDIIEGADNFSNVTITGIETSQPLFGTISGNGAGIINLNFRDISIESSAETPLGCIAGSITRTGNTGNGTVFENCNIYNGRVVSNGYVGMFAGSMEYGSLTGCSFSGFLMGASTASGNLTKLLATDPTVAPNLTDCSFKDNIIFTEI